MGDPRLVPVQNLGQLPTQFSSVDTVINLIDVNANGHDEGKVKIICRDEDPLLTFVNDDFDGYGSSVSGGYEFKIKIASESRVGLWHRGAITLHYDEQGDRWSMRGEVDRGRFSESFEPWKFCFADKALDVALQGMECMIEGQQDQIVKGALRSIKTNIEYNSSYIVATAPVYTESVECNAPTLPGEGENDRNDIYSSPIPWW